MLREGYSILLVLDAHIIQAEGELTVDILNVPTRDMLFSYQRHICR